MSHTNSDNCDQKGERKNIMLIEDLLPPKSADDEKWKAAPVDISNFKFGINTGTPSLKNPRYIPKDPPTPPKVTISPWNNELENIKNDSLLLESKK